MKLRRDSSRLIAAAALIGIALAAVSAERGPYGTTTRSGADLTPPAPPTPLAPALVSPNGEMLIGDQPVALKWNQGLSRSGTTYAPTTRFVVCVYEPGVTHDCRPG